MWDKVTEHLRIVRNEELWFVWVNYCWSQSSSVSVVTRLWAEEVSDVRFEILMVMKIQVVVF